MNLLLVAVGSAAGGAVRWWIAETLQHRLAVSTLWGRHAEFPVGTLVVNVTGSFILGALAVMFARSAADNAALRLLLAVGFCGGYTTFSAFSLDTFVLLEQGSVRAALLNVVSSLVLALLATLAGMLLMRAVLDPPGA